MSKVVQVVGVIVDQFNRSNTSGMTLPWLSEGDAVRGGVRWTHLLSTYRTTMNPIDHISSVVARIHLPSHLSTQVTLLSGIVLIETILLR